MNVSGADASTPEYLAVFANGRNGAQPTVKIAHLIEVAERCGYAVLVPDFSFSNDPRARIAHLLQLQPRASQSLVLIGASMGAYVSAMCCAALQPRALFLMAPALYLPDWDEEPEGIPAMTTVVHGWRDDIVPAERGQRFAARHKAALHLLDSGHRLHDQLPMLGLLLDEFLQRARVD